MSTSERAPIQPALAESHQKVAAEIERSACRQATGMGDHLGVKIGKAYREQRLPEGDRHGDYDSRGQ